MVVPNSVVEPIVAVREGARRCDAVVGELGAFRLSAVRRRPPNFSTRGLACELDTTEFVESVNAAVLRLEGDALRVDAMDG